MKRVNRSSCFTAVIARRAAVSRSPLVRVAAVALSLLSVPDLQAQTTYYWDNNGTTNGFGTATGIWGAPTTNSTTNGWSTNSAGSTLPSGTTTTTTNDALNFGTSSAGLATGTITVSGTVEANTLNFGSASGTITFTNGTITLGGSTPAISNTATVNMGSALAGSNGLTKNGAGQLTLTVSNTYTGMTTVNAGILRLQGGSTANLINGDVTVSGGALNYATANQLADTASITLNSGSVDFSTFNETISSIAMSGGTLRRSGGTFALTNASSFTGGTVNLVSGTGRINTAGTTTLGSATFSYSNAASSTTGLFLGGDIAVNVSTTANFTNNAAGVGRIDLNGANRTIDVGSGAAMNVGWTIAGTNGITKTNSGTLLLSGSNTYSGTTTIADGTVVLTNGSAIADTGVITNTAGTLRVNSSETIGSLRGGGNVDLNGDGVTLTIAETGTNTYSGSITNSGGLTMSGVGQLTLSGSNAYGGGTTLGSGTLRAGVNNVLGTGTFTINGGVFASDGGTARTMTNNITMGGNVTLGDATGTGALTLSNINLGGSTRTLTVSSATTVAGAISNGGLTKDGTAQLTLTASNTYTGMTTVNAGTLRLQGGSTANLINGDVTVSGGALNFATGNQLADTVSLTLNSGSVDFSIYNDTIGSIAMSGGTLRRSGASGATLALSTNSSFTGGTVNLVSGRINTAGTTTLGSATFSYSNAASSTTGLFLGGDIAVNASTTANFTNSAAGVGRIDLNGADRTIDVGSGAAMNVGWVIAGTNGIIKNGQGTFTLSGSEANSYSGVTTVGAGVLALNKTTGEAIAGNLVVNSGAILLISGSNQVASGGGQTVTLSGGTIIRAGGVSEVFGNLSLNAASFLDFGDGVAGNLRFGTYTPSALLTVQNFFAGNTLQFATQLTSEQLASDFSFDNGFSTDWNSGTSTFTITAIPEASTLIAAAGLLAVFLWPLSCRWIRCRQVLSMIQAPTPDCSADELPAAAVSIEDPWTTPESARRFL